MLRRGAFAPKQICRQTDSKQNDGSGEILELSRITERQVHGVADDGSRGKDEKNRRPGISWNAVGKRPAAAGAANGDRKSTRLNSSHTVISYAVFCLKKK